MTKNDPLKNLCSAEMMSRTYNLAFGQNLFSKMALEEKSLATPDLECCHNRRPFVPFILCSQM